MWARTLFSGETALISVNAGPTEAEISCDDKCIEAAGLTPGRTYRVRDLFGRRQLQPIALSAAGLSWSVPGDGGSVLVKLTAAV